MRRSRALRALLGVALLAALHGPDRAAAGEVCEAKPTGPVSLIILANGHKVRELAASVKDARVVRHDGETVIFDDGRVITADVAGAGDHLNALGWGSRRIDVEVTLPSRRSLPKSSFG